MGTCGGGVQPRTTQDLNLEKMLLLASILLLGCASAFAAGHGNAMGCCEVKRVSGSGPFSGSYYLDTDYSKAVPVSCKDSCVYMASGSKRYCFQPSSTYKAQCQDRSGSNGTTASQEDLAAEAKTIQEKMESLRTDIAEAERTKAAAEDISNKIGSLDMNTFTTTGDTRFRRQARSTTPTTPTPTTYPTPTTCEGLKSSMTDLANALDDAPNYDLVRARSIVTMLTSVDLGTWILHAMNLNDGAGCQWDEFPDILSAWEDAKNNAATLVRTQTNLSASKKAELDALASELNDLMQDMRGHCQGVESNDQCNGQPNGTPCEKDCAAHHADCLESACCHGCCKRGRVLFGNGNGNGNDHLIQRFGCCARGDVGCETRTLTRTKFWLNLLRHQPSC